MKNKKAMSILPASTSVHEHFPQAPPNISIFHPLREPIPNLSAHSHPAGRKLPRTFKDQFEENSTKVRTGSRKYYKEQCSTPGLVREQFPDLARREE